jgi:hypothetical protein
MDENDIISEIFGEVLYEHNVELDFEISKNIANDFADALTAYSEMKCEQYRPAPNTKSDYEKVLELQSKVNRLEKELGRTNKFNDKMSEFIQKKYHADFVGLDCQDNIIFQRE